MKVGSEFRIGALVTIGLIVALAGPAAAQSISVVVNTTTANAGDTITGSVQLEGLPTGFSGYQGHTFRVAIDPPGAITQDGGLPDITYTDGDLTIPPGVGTILTVVSPENVTMMNASLIQLLFPTVIDTFPATVFNFSFQLSSSFSSLTLHIVRTDEAGTGNDTLAITSSDNPPNNIIAITAPPFETLNDVTISGEPGENRPPVADAGPPQTVEEGALVTLDGSGSSDPDNDPLTYQWSQTAGPSVTLSDPADVQPTFTAPDVDADTLLTFQLEVTDDEMASDTDTVNITVQVPAPETGYIVLDGFGAMHSIGIHAATVTGNGLYYPGVDIVVDMDILPDNSGVVVIDKWGANFAFGFNDGLPSVPVNPVFIPEGVLPPMILDATPSYVAVEAAADSQGYWVLDDTGQLYGVGSVLAPGAIQSLLPGLAVDPPLPAYVADATNYLNPDGTPIPEGENRGWFSAVDFIVVNDGEGVIVSDRWGGQHIIGDTSAIGMTEETIHPYFGWDIVRAIEIEPQNRGYMLLDGFGAVHPVPSLPLDGEVREAYNLYVRDGYQQPYFGWDVAESLAYAVDGDGWVTLDAFGGTHYVGRIMPVRVLYFGWDIARDIEIYIPD